MCLEEIQHCGMHMAKNKNECFLPTNDTPVNQANGMRVHSYCGEIIELEFNVVLFAMESNSFLLREHVRIS